MPKLNPIHIIERLKNRIEQLENEEALEARDINALLTPIQQQQLKDDWAEQQAIRKSHKTKAAAEKAGLTWKSIRDIRLDVFRQALNDAFDNFEDDFEQLKHEREIRAARIFMDAYCEAKKAGRHGISAGKIALTRAGLKQPKISRDLEPRDMEIQKMEAELERRIRANMTPEELEQLELLEEHEANVRKGQK